MKIIESSDEAYERLDLAARVAGVSLTEALDRLVGVSDASPARVDAATAKAGDDEIAISVTYRGLTVTGFINLATERVRITAAPKAELVGSYRSPSHAAVETVRTLNPGRQHPETNGWRFWYAADGQLIDRHRRRHAS
jgi:hypothetical protein